MYQKESPTPSVKVASVCQNRPTKWQKTNSNCGAFKGKIELQKYSREEYDSIPMEQCQQLYELWKKAVLIKGKKTPEKSRALEARMAALEAKQLTVEIRAHLQIKSSKLIPALDRKGSRTRQICYNT